MAGDSYWSQTVLAMHMDDTGLTDSKGKTISLVGNVARSAASYAPLTGNAYSALFDGTGDYLTTASSLSDFVFGTGDFTVEMWVKTSVDGKALADFYTNGQNGWQLLLSGGALQFYVTSAVKTGSISVIDDVWHHLALVLSGGNLMFFIDGVQDGSPTALATNLSYQTTALSIGAQVASRNSAYDFNGYIDEVRITKAARYTANFTRPSVPFVTSGPTISGTVKDSSGNPTASIVRVYRRDTGALVTEVTSDGTTGAYSAAAFDGNAHYIVRLVSATENAQIFDNVTPT